MTRRAGCMVASALGLALWCAAAARAAESVLTIVPSDALGVGIVKNLSQADAKIKKLAGLVQAPPASPLDLVKAEFGIAKGLDEKGALALIVLPGPRAAEPASMMAVPVADYKEFLGQFNGAKPDEKISEITAAGAKTAVAHRGGYALLVPLRFRPALEKALDAKENIAGELAGIEPWLAENDAAFVGTRAGIRWAAAAARQELKHAEDLPDAGMGSSMDTIRAMLRFYDQMLALAEEEVALAAAAVSADDQGTVRVTGRVRFVKQSKLGESLAAIKPADQDLMAGLPPGPFVFAFGGAMPEPLMKRLAALGAGFIQKSDSLSGLSPEQAEQWAKISMQALERAHSAAMVMKTGKRGEPVYSNIFGAFRVDDSARFLDQYQKQLEAMNRVLKEAKSDVLKPSELKKTEIGGLPALEVEVTIPIPKTTGQDPLQQMQQTMMQAMFGAGGKMKYYVAPANETTAVFGYGTTAEKVGEAVEMVRSAKPGLAGDKDVALTAALLPAGAQWVGYVSPRGYMSMTQRMMQQMMAAMPDRPGFSEPAIPPFPQTSPVGMALKATSSGLEGTVVVPSVMLKAVGEYVNTMRQATMNPQIP
jgi:hypothetical protein